MRSSIKSRPLKMTLLNPENAALLAFTRKLFPLLKQANPQPEMMAKEVGKEILDIMAKLLVGDETCAAIAISGSELLLATNKRALRDDYFSIEKTCLVLKKQEDNFTIQYIDRLRYNDGKPIEKHSEPVNFRFNFSNSTWAPYSGNPRIVFSAEEHSVPGIGIQYELCLSDSVPSIKGKIHVKKLVGSLQYAVLDPYGDPVIDTISDDMLGELKTPEPFSLDKVKPLLPRILEITSIRQHTVDGSISAKGGTPKMLENIGRTPVGHEANVLPFPLIYELNPLRLRCGYLVQHLAFIAIAVIKHGGTDLEKKAVGARWMGRESFLSPSLSWELSTYSEYKKYIQPRDFTHPGHSEMVKFCSWLLENYEKYRDKHNIKKPWASSVINWLEEIRLNIQLLSIPVPSFIRNSPEKFLECFKSYLLNLIKVEDFVEKDARNNGRLSRILAREKPGRRTISVKHVPGIEDDHHAEMKLLNYHLEAKRDPSDYFGITMLCCGLCTWAMKQFKIVDYRGSSATLFFNWIINPEFRKPQHLQTLLGEGLFKDFKDIKDRLFQVNGDKIGKKRKGEEIIFLIISCIKGINKIEILQELGIDEKYHIPDSKVLSAPEEYDEDEKLGFQSPTDSKQSRKNLELKKTVAASLQAEEKKEIIGPRKLPGWNLQDAGELGNCFYLAVIDQLQLIQHQFLQEIPPGAEAHDLLRLRIQGRDSQDHEHATDSEIDQLVRVFDLIVAVVDTRIPAGGYVYRYLNEAGNVMTAFDKDSLPNKKIVKIACTGNYYLSVRSEPDHYKFSQAASPFTLWKKLIDNSLYDNRNESPQHRKMFDDRFGLVLR